MRTTRDGWTAADYDSQEILHQLGHRDAAARVDRARRPAPAPQAGTGKDTAHRPAGTVDAALPFPAGADSLISGMTRSGKTDAAAFRAAVSRARSTAWSA